MDPLGLRPCRYRSAQVVGPAFLLLVDKIAATRVNGQVLLASFQAEDVVDPQRWFRYSSVAQSDTDVRDLLGSEALRTAMPELRVPLPYPIAHPPRFEAGGALSLDGHLAAMLVQGGAYVWFDGTAGEAKRLAERGVDELVDGRYEDFSVHGSEAAWTPFFADVAWDATLLLVDHRRLQVTVFATTDTD